MSSGGSPDWCSPVNKSSSTSDVKSLLQVISEIINLPIMTENENFMTIGCYFYRVSSVISELESSKNTPKNAPEILLLLSEYIHIAKNLLFKYMIIQDPETESIKKHIERVIRKIGEVLNSIKSSSEDYFHHAIQSLVKDINGTSFKISDQDLYSINGYESSTDDESNETTIMMSFSDYMEPLYESFFCPLTKKIMEDPVTIETGVTYERFAITKWYEKFGNPADVVCPKTGIKITSRVMNRNIALMKTIKQWEERNEQASIKAAKSTLSLGINKTMILEALHNLQSLCWKNQYNVVEIRTIGVIPLLGTILEHEDRDLTFESLELLRQLTQNDDDHEGKEMIARTMDLSGIIQKLSSKDECIKHSVLLLLVELSKSRYFCDELGSVSGGILMLISLKYRQPIDAFASEKVDKILKNLEISPSNIKIMAENGYWQPILHHFLEGNEEMKMEMASYIEEIFLGNDDDEINGYVAETASPGLIQMVNNGNSMARNVAFGALKQISSHRENGKILVKSAKAVERLLTCFDHKNIKVVEAALSALCTLLDERVDLDSSVSVLIQEKAIQHVLNVVKEHKDESLRQKSFWVLEKLLMEGDDNSISEISQDRFLRATLINVLHYGNGDIRLMAEKIMRHLNKMPNFNTDFIM